MITLGAHPYSGEDLMLTPSSHLTEALLRASAHWQERHAAETQGRPGPGPSACTIAISREAGALGSSVGREVSARLGWQLYDQELLHRIGEEMGLRASLLQSVDETRANWLRDFLVGLTHEKSVSDISYVRHLIEVLLSLAAHGECVIVGRGAPHLLPADSTLRVRLVAPRPFRVGVIQKARGWSAEEAARWIDATDRERAHFVKAHFRKDPADPEQYDLIVNTGRFSVNQSAGLIIDALRNLEEARRS
jgi:cytidylate kinase